MSVENSGKALILDFGGVVTRTLFETHDITERALGLPAGTLTWRGAGIDGLCGMFAVSKLRFFTS